MATPVHKSFCVLQFAEVPLYCYSNSEISDGDLEWILDMLQNYLFLQLNEFESEDSI